MDWLNPIEWAAWIYGKLFQEHVIVGGILVTGICAAVGLMVWIRGVDKYKEEHPTIQSKADNSPKQQTVAAPNSPTPLDATVQPPQGVQTHQPLPNCTVDVAFYSNGTAPPPLSEVQATTDQLVDGYRRRNEECPTNDWLNEQLRKKNYPVWANVNCEAHGTGVQVNGQDTHFSKDIDIENLPCDIGVDVGKDAKRTTIDGKIKVRVAKPGHGDSVHFH
jgi:hypothetical protein